MVFTCGNRLSSRGRAPVPRVSRGPRQNGDRWCFTSRIITDGVGRRRGIMPCNGLRRVARGGLPIMSVSVYVPEELSTSGRTKRLHSLDPGRRRAFSSCYSPCPVDPRRVCLAVRARRTVE